MKRRTVLISVGPVIHLRQIDLLKYLKTLGNHLFLIPHNTVLQYSVPQILINMGMRTFLQRVFFDPHALMGTPFSPPCYEGDESLRVRQ